MAWTMWYFSCWKRGTGLCLSKWTRSTSLSGPSMAESLSANCRLIDSSSHSCKAFASHPRIQEITHTVADEAEGQDRHAQRGSWHQCRPGRYLQIRLSCTQHVAQ